MLVMFTGVNGINRNALWIEADLVRAIGATAEGERRTVIYQQDSDMPFYVAEELDVAVKRINEGRTNAGTSQS